MTLPLSKTLDLADFEELARELMIVDRYFTKAREQHPMRRWEYAMALRAYHVWKEGHPPPATVADVGGEGSPFPSILAASINPYLDPYFDVTCIDPALPDGQSLASYLSTECLGISGGRMGPLLHQVVFCLSVLEHIDDLDRFLYHLSCLVAPGGLLFLTADCCGCLVPHGTSEPHHFHWMRKRIFTTGEWRALVGEPLLDYSFTLLGAHDLTWHGAHVFDYSFVSLAMVKRP